VRHDHSAHSGTIQPDRFGTRRGISPLAAARLQSQRSAGLIIKEFSVKKAQGSTMTQSLPDI